MNIKIIAFFACVGCFVSTSFAEDPIKALLITGGCCHDYDNQKTIIPEGIEANTDVEIEWTIIHQGGKAGNVEIPFHKNPDWAKGYDVVVHNECFANISNDDFVRGILAPHNAGTPAVLVHCAMHSYRGGESKTEWYKFCGAHTKRHGPKHPFTVEIVAPDHAAAEGVEGWTTPEGELYFIETVYPGTTVIAQSKSNQTGAIHPNIWAHEYGENKTRVFATTIGHHNSTMQDPAYQKMLSKGFIWAAGKETK